MTPYKPPETFEYLVEMDKKLNLKTTVYIVADKIPEILYKNNIKTVLLPTEEFQSAQKNTSKDLYRENPDECCKLLKVNPTKIAVKYLDAWVAGLRNTEGRIREDYREIEFKGGLVKINPILTFTEDDVLNYLDKHKIPLHPWYLKEFPDGTKYRSLGCAPCTKPIPLDVPERMGRWQETSKCGGECGIHTQILKSIQIEPLKLKR
jgi:phosphoadenosine phosphosulfate reductase